MEQKITFEKNKIDGYANKIHLGYNQDGRKIYRRPTAPIYTLDDITETEFNQNKDSLKVFDPFSHHFVSLNVEQRTLIQNSINCRSTNKELRLLAYTPFTDIPQLEPITKETPERTKERNQKERLEFERKLKEQLLKKNLPKKEKEADVLSLPIFSPKRSVHECYRKDNKLIRNYSLPNTNSNIKNLNFGLTAKFGTSKETNHFTNQYSIQRTKNKNSRLTKKIKAEKGLGANQTLLPEDVLFPLEKLNYTFYPNKKLLVIKPKESEGVIKRFDQSDCGNFIVLLEESKTKKIVSVRECLTEVELHRFCIDSLVSGKILQTGFFRYCLFFLTSETITFMGPVFGKKSLKIGFLKYFTIVEQQWEKYSVKIVKVCKSLSFKKISFNEDFSEAVLNTKKNCFLIDFSTGKVKKYPKFYLGKFSEVHKKTIELADKNNILIKKNGNNKNRKIVHKEGNLISDICTSREELCLIASKKGKALLRSSKLINKDLKKIVLSTKRNLRQALFFSDFPLFFCADKKRIVFYWYGINKEETLERNVDFITKQKNEIEDWDFQIRSLKVVPLDYIEVQNKEALVKKNLPWIYIKNKHGEIELWINT